MSQADDEDFGDFNEPEIAPLPEDDTLPSTKHGDPVPQTLSSPRPSAEQNAPATAEPSKSTSAFDDLFDFGPALSVDKNENGGFETRVSESRDNEVLKSGEEHVEESTKREDNEEFGDFGEPEIVEETVEVVGTESSVPDALESTDHVVGADGDAIKEPEASTSQVDDDFGDFATEAEGSGHVEEVATEEPIAQSLEDQPLAAEVAQPPKESELSAPPPTEEEEDDFGDFGEADEAAAADSALAQPEPTPVEPAATPSTPAPRAAVASLDLEGLPELDFATKETIQRTISPLLERLFPDSDLPTATPSSPVPLLIPQSDLSGRTYLTPNPALAGEPWYQLWQTLADKPTYDEATGLPLFMWRRSEVRKNWLKALQVPVNLDDMFPPSKPVKTTIASTDPKSPSDPAIAQLLDLSEDQLRQMSVPQLRQMVAQLTKAVKDESNAYNVALDKKQKLVDESDRHNKMIGTLVQIAQMNAMKKR